MTDLLILLTVYTFESQYLLLLFEETVLTIACSDLRKKEKKKKKKLFTHLDNLEILIVAFPDVSSGLPGSPGL